MWIIILLIIVAYLLFNAVITLVCIQEQDIGTSGKALLLTLGMPIVIIVCVVAVVEKVRKR